MQTLIGTLHYPDFIWAICTIVFAFIGLGRKIGLVFLLFHFIHIIIFFLYNLNIHLEHLKPVSFYQSISVMFELIVAFFSLSYLIHHYVIIQKSTESQLIETNKELVSKNHQNEFLLKEIHHRIKNNLQIVVSLLRMQMNEIDSPNIKHAFEKAIQRILSISAIHQSLYQSEHLKAFDLEKYILDLTDEIKKLNPDKQTEIKLDIELNDIGLKTLVPFGLILNELITNSIKHAFSEDNINIISIKIDQCSKETICLYYCDSGFWKENSKISFGLELIDVLTQQLDGSVKRKNSLFEFKLNNLDLQ